MTDRQREVLQSLCDRYHSTFNENDFHPQFDLPTGYVAGWVGRPTVGQPGAIYVGCSPVGEISS